MPFVGTIINFVTVLIAGTLGAFLKRGIPERLEQAIMSAIGACVVIIGAEGALAAPPAVPGIPKANSSPESEFS